MIDQADEGMDLVVGDEGADRGEGADHLDAVAREADLLLGLAERRLEQLLALIPPAAGEGDLPGMPAQVRAPLGEDQAGVLRPAVHRNEDGGLGAAVGVEAFGLLWGEQKTAQLR